MKKSVLNRRCLLQAGGISVGAFALPDALRARSAAPSPAKQSSAKQPPARQVIMILLQGGCSHLDTWDLKPEAPAEIRGEFEPIATTIPGYSISEHLPLLAQRVHRFNVLRSVYHATPSHEAAIHWVLTGYDYPGANTTTRNRNVKPAVGSIVSKVLGQSRPGLPAYVCVPDTGQLGARVHYAEPSYLGIGCSPFESGMPPSDARSPFASSPNLKLSGDVDLTRLDHRLALLRQFDQLPKTLDSSGVMEGMDEFHRQALEILAGDATRNAFDLSQESVELRERYGSTRMGQEAILARRLAEAGVPFTLVNFSINQEFDTHTDNFNALKKSRLPQMERAVAALLDDLEARGLLETTLVALVTEFGRTPKINSTAGRDHWSDVFSIVLAGGGLKSGRVLGTSNSRGERPLDRPIHYNDVLATIYRQLGVPTDRAFPDASGRPLPVLGEGTPIPELL